MFRFSSADKNLPTHSIFRWFLVGFASFSLILFLALLPLVFYCRSVFTELEIKKSTQQMDFGINQLDNTITTIANASQAFYDDNRFYALNYTSKDYTDISAVTRNQMRDYLSSLIRPCTMIRDCALQLSANDAVTPIVTTFGLQVGYYPFYFRVDEMTYDEWNSLLQENRTGFVGVHHVSTTYNGSYDALIYSIYRANSRYFYACIDLAQLKKALIAKEDLDSYLFTLHNSSGDCIYTELSGPASNYYSISRQTASGGLTITMHIPNVALTVRMKPLYSFLSIYLVLCILVLGVSIPIGTHLSTRPLTRIIYTLEKIS